MFYWFKRENALIRYEVRASPPGTFELVILDETGRETVETFSDEVSLHARQVALERTLANEGWSGPHGWNM